MRRKKTKKIYSVYVDTSYQHNTRMAITGMLLFSSEKVYKRMCKFNKVQDSVAGEYIGLLDALKWAKNVCKSPKEIHVHTDLKQLAAQIRGDILPPKKQQHIKPFVLIRQFIEKLNKKKNLTFIIVTHDDIAKNSDRIIKLKDGKIINDNSNMKGGNKE